MNFFRKYVDKIHTENVDRTKCRMAVISFIITLSAHLCCQNYPNSSEHGHVTSRWKVRNMLHSAWDTKIAILSPKHKLFVKIKFEFLHRCVLGWNTLRHIQAPAKSYKYQFRCVCKNKWFRQNNCYQESTTACSDR